MPPKKKKASKDAEISDKELLQKAQAEITALTRLLELKTYEVRQQGACARLLWWCLDVGSGAACSA